MRRCFQNFMYKCVRRFAWQAFCRATQEVQMLRPRVFGDMSRIVVHPTAQVNDALFNLSSGSVRVGPNAFFGHGVSVITGRHDPCATGAERRDSYPQEGCDVEIGEGAWIGSNATILGPCKIGRNSVVGAMCLVRSDVPENVIVAGVPARVIKSLPINSPTEIPLS